MKPVLKKAGYTSRSATRLMDPVLRKVGYRAPHDPFRHLPVYTSKRKPSPTMTELYIRLLLKGLREQLWCFTHGAFVMSNGNSIFNILMQDGKAYKRISTHQKYFVLNEKSNKTQYGYDFKPVSFSCGNENKKKIVYRTLLFFKLPKNRIYMKFEQYGTKKISNLIYHGIDLVRTQFRKAEEDFRRETQPAFSRNFPRNWNANKSAVGYHPNRVGREVYLGKSSHRKVLKQDRNKNLGFFLQL